MLSWFSKKEEVLNPLDFSVLKTDLHSHILPGIDDGPKDIDTAIKIIQQMKALGFRKLITSPHVMSDSYKNTNETIINALNSLRSELYQRNVAMDINAIAEYYIDYDFEMKIGKEDFLTFGDNYILVELSFFSKPKNLFDIFFKLQLEGYSVVLAHPERYNYFDFYDYRELVRRGIFFQINWLSIIGYYSSKVEKKVKNLIAENMVSFIGTDCHNMHQATLYKECQNKKCWHDLYNSGRLLNSYL